MIRVAIATLGCKVNQYESAGMIETLGENGFSPVPFGGEADVYVINTCTVTGKSEFQSRQLIRRAARANAEAAIVVTGCSAQMFSKEIARIPGVAMVAGNVEKGNILSLVRDALRGEKKIMLSDIRRVSEFSTPAAGALPGRTRAFLKIQDGCDAFCSYCIVPYARGKSRSLAASDVISRVAMLTEAGYRELVLTGINLGAYGRDLDPVTDLRTLLEGIADTGALPRLRLSSLEPREITHDMLSLIKEKPVFCRHFHIPLQSGADGILSRMERNYDAAFFRRCVESILNHLPDAAIGVDVMVGFPGEGEEEFSHTRRLLEELPIAYLHVFPYSPRPGTPAALLPNQVTEADKKRRAAVMRSLGRKKREAFAEQFFGRELTVLLEARSDRESGWMTGFSGNYIPVAVESGEASFANKLVRVVAEERRDGKLIGRIVAHDD